MVLIDDEKGFVPMQADLLVQDFHYCMFHQNVGRSIKGFHLVLALLTVPGFANKFSKQSMTYNSMAFIFQCVDTSKYDEQLLLKLTKSNKHRKS